MSKGIKIGVIYDDVLFKSLALNVVTYAIHMSIILYVSCIWVLFGTCIVYCILINNVIAILSTLTHFQ